MSAVDRIADRLVSDVDQLDAARQRVLLESLAADLEANDRSWRARGRTDEADEQAAMAARIRAHLNQ